MEEYDLIILGAGPAGLSAGVYAARYKIKTLIIGQLLGGMTGEAHEIVNFPSYEKITGFELVKKLVNQVKKLGISIKMEGLLDVKKIKNGFEVRTNKNNYLAKKLIIATGTEKKKIGLPREEEFVGKGISYCATCDASFYKDKTVGIVGGSNSALTSASLLEKYAKKVYIFYRQKDFFMADPSWVDDINKNKKIEPLFNSEVVMLIGRNKLEGVELSTGKELKLDGLFIEIGSIPNTDLEKKLGIKTDKNGYITTDKNQKTNVEGVYAAGDITDNPLKQIITACSQGAVAAYSAWKESERKK